jgi:tetratricopeptide (TPR) repeat protein
MIVPYPPLEAYRRDIARLDGQPFGPDDGRWIAAATLLQRYTESDGAERREIGRRLASHLAYETELTFCSAGLQLAHEIEEAGALHLATAWLALLEQSIPTDHALDFGRVRATRARVARRLGDVEAARVFYADVEQVGESRAEPELTARAWIGYGVIAIERGNYPEARRWYEAAALVADDTGCAAESSQAHGGLMHVYAKAGDMERAIVEGWRAFDAMPRDDSRSSELLNNLSQALYDTGQFATALRGFGAAVRRATHPRILLAALGGTATAAGALGRETIVEAAAARIERIVRTAWSHPVALAYLDLSDAFSMLGETSRSAEFRQAARELAEANSYYELLYRAAEPSATRPVAAVPAPLVSTTTKQVIGYIGALETPADLRLVG